MHLHVHCSTIRNSQDMETTQKSMGQMIGFGRGGIYTQWNTTQPLKNNKIMPLAATWMELETLILTLK